MKQEVRKKKEKDGAGDGSSNSGIVKKGKKSIIECLLDAKELEVVKMEKPEVLIQGKVR